MDFDTLWTMEERFWLDGPEFHENALSPDALMVFPAPVGILTSDEIVEGLEEGPRWVSVDFQDTAETISGDTAVLAYQATGESEGGESHVALCSSTYVREGDGWVLLAHQQTPVE